MGADCHFIQRQGHSSDNRAFKFPGAVYEGLGNSDGCDVPRNDSDVSSVFIYTEIFCTGADFGKCEGVRIKVLIMIRQNEYRAVHISGICYNVEKDFRDKELSRQGGKK